MRRPLRIDEESSELSPVVVTPGSRYRSCGLRGEFSVLDIQGNPCVRDHESASLTTGGVLQPRVMTGGDYRCHESLGDALMLRLSRDEAAKHFGTSMSTLDRWIRDETVQSEVLMVGKQRRVVVLIPEEGEMADEVGPIAAGPEIGSEGLRERVAELEADLRVERERNKGLEELVEMLREQVTFERSRYAEIYHDVRPMLEAPKAITSESWWRRFWNQAVTSG